MKNENEPIVSTKELGRRGVCAVGCLAGGVVLGIIGAVPSGVGIALGAGAGVLGLVALCSKDPADKLPGGVLLGGGVLAVAAKIKLPLIGGLAGGILTLGAAALVGLGVWNGIKFFKGLKSRQ